MSSEAIGEGKERKSGAAPTSTFVDTVTVNGCIPTMPAAVIAERIGWDRSIRTVKQLESFVVEVNCAVNA